MYAGHQTDVLVMDFSKAFDKVGHWRLLTKLQGYSVTGEMNSWIQNWPANRTQVFVIDGEQSGPLPVTSRVPQPWLSSGTLPVPLLHQWHGGKAAVHCSPVCWRRHILLNRRQPVWCHGPTARSRPPCWVGADLADGIPSQQVVSSAGHQQTPPKHHPTWLHITRT